MRSKMKKNDPMNDSVCAPTIFLPSLKRFLNGDSDPKPKARTCWYHLRIIIKFYNFFYMCAPFLGYKILVRDPVECSVFKLGFL